jgi:cyclophilin family peptidyl-prolyl cis-trans isomerase
MAEHKAPTAVEIAPTEERSWFAQWVDRNWKRALALAVVTAGVILFLQYQDQARSEAQDASWGQLLSVTSTNPQTGLLQGTPDDLTAFAADMGDTAAAPWALYLAATSALTENDFDKAQASLAKLRSDYADHILVKTTYPFGADGDAQMTIPEHLQGIVDKHRTWRTSHPELFSNAEPPADAPRVRINTSAGPVVVGLYPEAAPKHVENFLKLCGEGFYDGTKFHRVVNGFMIQGGDPNSKEDDVSTWGNGGPGYKVEAEENDLKHFAGYLSAAKTAADVESSGSQFFITTGSPHHLDGKHVVYGKVLEGMDSVTEIEAGAIVTGTDRPVNPATITSTELL